MKRGLALVCALMLNAAPAEAEAPERHIETTISGEGYAISVDADVYGADVGSAQAYRVWTLDWGQTPEKYFNLALWFDADMPLEKAGKDYTLFYPKGEEERLGEREEAGFSPYGMYFVRATDARLEFPLERWNYRRMQESPDTEAVPQGFSIEAVTTDIQAIANALGVTIETQPVFVSAMTLADWQAETSKRLEQGIAPDECVVSDWAVDDESIQLNYRQLFHGLPMLETDAHMPGIFEWETPLTMISTTVSRRGLERLDFPFVAGQEEALDEPFKPISPEEALAVCTAAQLHMEGWKKLHVSRLELGYVMLAKNIAKTELEARPAWLIRIWGEIFGEKQSITVAVDAQTGKIVAM